ncbi:hypothetical protein GCM10007301_04490 [Azorhizobium oxalatiphilum]|uniref:Tlde1 domain-containing protein n=1 Tax=Azorhizobium oxalatiphilum TaxID=980631 RepID=A0A917F5D4_9HYPH|nr:DUF2778 domain-containing protein [Azorhizobium oxalatiphilum]GGF48313.1 hypothetical protein GCM10007301_04490 [Azorhizobium oxalatiphilum]
MTYTAWIDDDDAYEAPVASKSKVRPVVRGGIYVGFGIAAAAILMVAIGGGHSTASVPSIAEQQLAEAPAPALVQPPEPILASRTHARAVGDVFSIPSSGSVAPEGRDLMYGPAVMGEQTALIRSESTMVAALEEPRDPEAVIESSVRVVPLPSANPLFASRSPAELKDLDHQLVAPPMPTRNPLVASNQRLAAIEPAERTAPERPSIVAPIPPGAESMLPGPTDKFALYDITGKVVYMPNGDKLEAHSGYGEYFDDPKYVHKKMVGPTPPNVYNLRMREALFHGVEAIRMLPVGDGPMYGRDGILTHTYLLGARGDSNGCISFKDYPKFLAAFKRGEVTRVVVVASLPKGPEPNNPLLAWLSKAAGH